MSHDQHAPSAPDRGRRWFRPNRSGPGWHPASWQGWLIIVGVVAALVALVVLFRTGVL